MTRTALVIDDNPVNVLLLERLLAARTDLATTSAGSGAEGLARARENPPDLLFLDLHLPDMSGNDVLATMRAEAATALVPVVFVTADLDPVIAVDDDPLTQLLPKPLDAEQLVRVVDTALPRP